MSKPSTGEARSPQDPAVRTGAEVLASSDFARLSGRRIGLITNHTGTVGSAHLADLLATARGVTLAAILAPEHGFRGRIEAGEKVANDRDERTGAPVLSLYGATRQPTPQMLAGLDALVFDIQDIGARFYTYISTMGLAMQAAAKADMPFLVLDRPNPLGGEYVSGPVLLPNLRSFVGQYTIPIVHGLTVGELARMIQGEGLLPGLDRLNLDVVPLEGWRRTMRWPETGLAWQPTSPNIPSFASALVYPGIGLIGELEMNEGRGTDVPFQQFGAPWLDAPSLVARLADEGIPGVDLEAVTYVPRAIPGVAATPKFLGETVNGVRIHIREAAKVSPLELGVQAISLLAAQARRKGTRLFPSNLEMFHRITGTRAIAEMLAAGAPGRAVIDAWSAEVAAFRDRRRSYLLYPA